MATRLNPDFAPIDVERLAREFRSARPFPFVVIDGLLRPEFALEVAAAFPNPDEAARIGRTFRAVNEAGKTQVTGAEHFREPIRKLCSYMADPAWLEVISQISGTPHLLADDQLAGGGIHLMRPGAHLDVHVDFNRLPASGLFRRLNLLVFMNAAWEASFGGELELWDRDVRACAHALLPMINRCVLFETSEHSFHGVRRITSAAGFARQSFAAYYYTREAPSNYRGIDHDTMFRARPDERWKRYVSMPIERLWRETTRRARGAARALRG